MQSWLGVLKEQHDVFAKQEMETGNEGGSLSVTHSGWMTLTRVDITHTLGRKFFMLVTEQKKVADEMQVLHTLYFFESEEASVDLGSGSALDLSEVEEVSDIEDNKFSLSTEGGWQLELEPETSATEWKAKFGLTCINAEGYDAMTSQKSFAPKAKGGAGGAVVLEDELKMNVISGTGFMLRGFKCQLTDDGELNWKMKSDEVLEDFAEDDVEYAIDVTAAIGVWVVGSAGFKKLDVILTGKKYVFQAESDATLEKWYKQIQALVPVKPVQELMKGWLEKRGDKGGGWKSRFFVLLSTRELLYFESENSAKRKGTVDLKMASEVNALPDDFSNYEEAFEVVTGKRRWIMCPESRNQKIMWVEALEPMIGGADVDGSGGGGRAVYNTRNSTTSMATASKCIKEGWLHRQGDADSEEGMWEKRYAKLMTCWRDGEQEATLEWYLDDAGAPDEDADEMSLPGGKAEPLSKDEAAEGGRPHTMHLSMLNGDAVISCEKDSELEAWVEALNTGWEEVKLADTQQSRLASFKPQSKAAKDAGGLLGARTGTIMGGRTATLLGGKKKDDGMLGGRTGTMLGKRTETMAKTPRGVDIRTPDASNRSELGGGVIEETEAAEIHSGFMTKKGEGLVAKWQERWFVLYADGGLTYAESQSAPAKGKIELAGLKRQDIQRSHKKSTSDYSFSIKTPGRKWLLNPGTEKAFDVWEEKIISVCKG